MTEPDNNAWLQQHTMLFGEQEWPEGALLALSCKETFAADMVHPLDVDAAWDYARERGFRDIYIRVAPVRDRLYGEWERGKKGDSVATAAFVLDIDTAGGVHAAEDLPTAKEAGRLVRSLLTPSLIIATGGGFHCYYLLKDPLLLQSEEEGTLTDDALSLYERWSRRWGAAFSERGWHLDTGVAKNPAGVLRMAGTLNWKTNPPQPVRILEADPLLTYKVDDLLRFAPEVRRTAAQRSLSAGRSVGGPLAKRVNAALPVSLLMEQAWGLVHDGGNRWVFPRENGRLGSDTHAQTWTLDNGVEVVTAFGSRLQRAWSQDSEQHSLRSWDLLCIALGAETAERVAKACINNLDDLVALAAAAVRSSTINAA
jgi:hypothetical protein